MMLNMSGICINPLTAMISPKSDWAHLIKKLLMVITNPDVKAKAHPPTNFKMAFLFSALISSSVKFSSSTEKTSFPIFNVIFFDYLLITGGTNSWSIAWISAKTSSSSSGSNPPLMKMSMSAKKGTLVLVLHLDPLEPLRCSLGQFMLSLSLKSLKREGVLKWEFSGI